MEGALLAAAQAYWAEIAGILPGFMAGGFLGSIVATIFFWAVDKLSTRSVKFANFMIIGVQVSGQLATFNKAKDALQAALDKGDIGAANQASDDLDDALGNLGPIDTAHDSP